MLNTDLIAFKTWTQGIEIEEEAAKQLSNLAKLPILYKHIAVMPDVHWGMGATVGSVLCSAKAIIPAAVGVDIGCGMMAVRTGIAASDLPDNLREIRLQIEQAVPHGRTNNGVRGDRGAWGNIPQSSIKVWQVLEKDFLRIAEKHPLVADRNVNTLNHLGTLGTGNHFIELCLDEQQILWIMLHSGSRGVGNRIGTYFVELAKQDMGNHLKNLPDSNLAYLNKGTQHFDDYVFAVQWAQNFAQYNRQLMMQAVVEVLKKEFGEEKVSTQEYAINCHHNYVAYEKHFDRNVWVTRKGAVKAALGDLGIIPGSMGAKSYIVRGKGNAESFNSCSHGAGRRMSRTEAKKKFSLEDHRRATEGVECRKDKDVIDETPGAYKDIDTVMAAQSDLVEIVHTLKQVLCVKG